MNFLKSIVVGLGAIAPGLSGSILLVLFGLYQKIVSAVSTLFKNFKKNVLFLLPIVLGIGVGVLLFSKLIALAVDHYPMQTNYAFLGLILGTIPMLWKEVSKEGFHKKHYIFAAAAFVFGVVFFVWNAGAFPDVQSPNFLQSMLLGVAVAASYLVPGVDSFAILSSFGLYDLWLHSLSDLNFTVLIPAALGFAVAAVCVALLFHKLLSKWYTGTYAVVFGLFLSVVLNFVFKEVQVPALNGTTAVSVVLFLLGLAFSLTFSRIEQIVAHFKKKKAGEEAVSSAEKGADEEVERVPTERQSADAQPKENRAYRVDLPENKPETPSNEEDGGQDPAK